MPNPSFTKFWNLAPDVSNPNILNMYVYGEIKSHGSCWFGGPSDVVTSTFIKDLNRYPDVDTINVYINSPGGEVFAAAAIRNQLRQHKATVHTWGEGLIASAAVGLLGAASPGCRHMSKSALMMIHDPMTRVQGNVRDLEKGIEVLNKVKNTIVNIYEEDTGLPRDQIISMMSSEKYLEAAEAKELGFIDIITEEESEMSITNTDTFIYNGVSCAFSNFADPEALKNKLMQLATVKNVQSDEGGKDMTFETILNSLPEEHQVIVRNHISSAITEASNKAVSEKQAIWDADKAQLEADLATARAQITAPPQVDPEDAIIDALPEEARKIVMKAKADAAAANAKLEEAAEAKAFGEFLDTLKVYDALPMTEEQQKALYAVNKADAERYKDLAGLLTIANNAMTAGFKPVGSDQGVPQATNAYDEIENKVKALRAENNALTYNEAFRKVVTENPELYNRYRNGE